MTALTFLNRHAEAITYLVFVPAFIFGAAWLWELKLMGVL